LLADENRTLEHLILSERALSRGLFERSEIVALVEGQGLDPLERELRLFTIASLELWLRTNVDEVRLKAPRNFSELVGGDEREPSGLQPVSS